ncbi:MAG: hypothetical protein QOJ19_3961 [Acidimicrobiia bacterium]|jgi:hypothetical protein|nr:hypothetical protein [Acidimicrobiia bacterium]
MIVQELPDGRLWCINQTSHAHQAEEFCRRWGNGAFAPPAPYGPVLLGVSQHDNGWYDWELEPELRPDGYPMDFIHGPDWATKLHLWWRGIRRAFDQHPYAGVLVGHHAALLYEGLLESLHLGEEEREATQIFIDEQANVRAEARRLLGADEVLAAALEDEAVEAHTRLLQFGDLASLVVCVPWAARRIERCPVDMAETFTAISMEFDERRITFDPWPYGVDHFEVTIWGRVLEDRVFPDADAYRQALAVAPGLHKCWSVERA